MASKAVLHTGGDERARLARVAALDYLFRGPPPSATFSPIDGSPMAACVVRLGSSHIRDEFYTTEELVRRASAFIGGKRACWVDLRGGSGVVAPAIQAFGLSSLAYPNSEQSERVDLEDDLLLIVVKEFEGETVTAVLAPTFLFTFHPPPVASVVRSIEILKRLAHDGPLPADVALFALLREVMASALLTLDGIYGEIAALERLVLVLGSGEQSDLLRRIGAAVNRISSLRTWMTSKGLLLRDLGRCKRVLSKETVGFVSRLRALQEQSEQRLELAAKFVNALSSTYLSRSSLTVALNTEEASLVLRRYNVLTSIMLPLLLLQGVFSMNVLIPGKTGYPGNDGLTWFFSLVATFVGLSVLMFLAMYKLHWW